MEIHRFPAIDTRQLLTTLRTDLIDLLSDLSPSEWSTGTAVPRWRVKDLVLHLLDDDLSVLSRGRDRDASGVVQGTTHDEFVQSLAAKNQLWIDGAQKLSSEASIGLIRWAGLQLDEYYQTLELDGEGHVSWASDEPVPTWLDIAREFTERWVHQMQIREGVDRVGDHVEKYLPTVLRTFVWAMPHQYRVDAAEGLTVQVNLESGGTWHLMCLGSGRWSLGEGPSTRPDASAHFSDDAAWRWLTGGSVPPDGVVFEGPGRLTDPILQIRAIIA